MYHSSYFRDSATLYLPIENNSIKKKKERGDGEFKDFCYNNHRRSETSKQVNKPTMGGSNHVVFQFAEFTWPDTTSSF